MAAVINAPSGVNFGEQFTFDVSTSRDDQWIRFTAYRNGMNVFSDVRSAHEGGYGYLVPFQAGPSMRWPSGAAQGLGELGHQGKRGFRVDAHVDFEIGP